MTAEASDQTTQLCNSRSCEQHQGIDTSHLLSLATFNCLECRSWNLMDRGSIPPATQVKTNLGVWRDKVGCNNTRIHR